jgi:hypothetical protein
MQSGTFQQERLRLLVASAANGRDPFVTSFASGFARQIQKIFRNFHLT